MAYCCKNCDFETLCEKEYIDHVTNGCNNEYEAISIPREYLNMRYDDFVNKVNSIVTEGEGLTPAEKLALGKKFFEEV